MRLFESKQISRLVEAGEKSITKSRLQTLEGLILDGATAQRQSEKPDFPKGDVNYTVGIINKSRKAIEKYFEEFGKDQLMGALNPKTVEELKYFIKSNKIHPNNQLLVLTEGKDEKSKKALEDEYNTLTTSPEDQKKNAKRIAEIEKLLAD